MTHNPKTPDIKRWAREFAHSYAMDRGLRLTRTDAGQMRTDVGELFFLEQQLEAMMAESFDFLEAPRKSRTLFPTRNVVSNGAETWAYAQYRHRGRAKIVSDYATDLPVVNADGTKFTGSVVTIADQFLISLNELQAASFAQKPLESTLLMTARDAIEQTIDDIAASGDTTHGLTGFTAIAASATPPPLTGVWIAPATPDQIYEDIRELWYSIPIDTRENHWPNTLVLADTLYPYLSNRMTDTDITIEQFCLKNLRGIQRIESWDKLNTAGAGGVARMMAFEASPRTGWLDIPQEFTPLAPQWKSLAYSVPCYAKTCGAIVPYPRAFAYMDGC